MRCSGFKRLLASLMALCLTAGLDARERIFTWVDENGQIRHTVIEEADSELLPTAAEHESMSSPSLENDPKDQALKAVSEREPDPEQAASGSVELSELRATAAPEKRMATPKIPTAASDRHSAPDGQARILPDGQIELDGVVYEDAAALEARGFTRPDRPRFYTWMDATGQVRSDPLPIVEKVSPESEAPPAIESDEAVVLARAVEAEGALLENCCAQFESDTFNLIEWPDEETELLLIFEKGDSRLPLLGGETPWRLIRLPKSNRAQMLRLRTFVEKRALYPTLITLDEAGQPVRVLRDIVYRYEPDSWFRHAYIEGYIEVRPDERQLLVVVSHDDLERQTVTIGLTDEPIIVRHGVVGQVHLKQVTVR